MKKNKNCTPKDKKLNVFVPFVNLLLFEKFESPNFNSDNEKLSENYIEAAMTNNQTNLEFNDFFIDRFCYFLSQLSEVGRQQVCDNIIENDLYITSFSIGYMMENDLSIDQENSFTGLEEIFKKLFDFKIEGKLSLVLFYFFTFNFEYIFNTKFSEQQNILKKEYNFLIDNILQKFIAKI